jgi:hypothetical protein
MKMKMLTLMFLKAGVSDRVGVQTTASLTPSITTPLEATTRNVCQIRAFDWKDVE